MLRRRHVLLVTALVLAVTLTGCSRGRGTAARRIVEREELVRGAHVRLRSELTPARGTLGDPIAWHLSASVPEGLTSVRIGVDPPPPDLEIDTTRTAPGEYLLRGFGLGAIPLPRATLVVRSAGRLDTLDFPHDTLFVDSLSAQATGQIRPDRGPIDTPLRPLDYGVLIAAGLLLLALLLFLVRLVLRSRRRAETAAASAPPEPPEAILERDLAALERELTSLPRDVFYERLAQILRSYAAAVTGVPALDLTTSELDRTLQRSEKVSARGRELMIGALRRADLAKFARYEDEESEARSIVRQARSVAGAL